ncbi:hypothetical protein [Salisediminibacterium selenitireducens]|uniref:Aminodeoxychorismate lyase n=1 Tax=Bacillus selenitireducens (strain ATCC 700615 / DSM 15326 / MLS10) TaxID=439292 RepID=D6XW66_BACIE|nr:hypothetical protein [Salisediminibacterium selenitireducens]ADH99820.1 hypothetical protein Bsel_2317 [[Bacillus] selenitireducens MLS10]
MKEQMRGAASALFFSGIVLAYLYFFHPAILGTDYTEAEENVADNGILLELEETITELETLNQSLENDRQVLEEEIRRLEDNRETTNQTEEYNPPLIHAMLEISPGETSSVISERLFDLQIIDSRNAFEAELNEHNRADRIQTGSFFLTSDMDNEDIIETITNP